MTNLNKTQVLSMMNANLDSGMTFTARTLPDESAAATSNTSANVTSRSYGIGSGTNTLSCWHYWQDHYYPTVIRESYPVYIEQRAKDKGKQAFEIIKVLKDKKLVN